MLKTSSLILLQNEFDITPESHRHEKMQSCNVLLIIPRYAKSSDLVSMSIIGNFYIWENFGIFVLKGKRDQIIYRR